MFTFLSFFAIHLALVAVMLVAVAGAGTLAAGSDQPLPLRCALGVALWAEALFLLAALHALSGVPIAALLVIAIGGGLLRGRFFERASWRWQLTFIAIGVPLFLLALHPPLAFDETLYHLPFVHSLARNGGLQFFGALRFPVFPQFQELLAIPAWLIAGDIATHLIAFVELLVLTALIAMWGRRYSPNAAPLAAALFIGSPIVLHLGTILYVDMALVLFVTAGFCLLDIALTESRRSPLLFSAFFFAAACCVKYLGGYFAIVALVIVVILRRREALIFAMTTAAAALPTTIWIFIATGNPLFPFATRLFGTSDWALRIEPTPGHKLLNTLRVAWDVTFARTRMNTQPPVTPLLIAMILVVAATAIRNVRARIVVVLSAVYLAIFAFLPQDTRYLVPLLPLFCVIVAVVVAKRLPQATVLLTLIALAPGVAYLGWRLHRDGLPPATAEAQSARIASHVDGYRALKHAGTASVYVCGAEQLQAYATGPLFGDFNGPRSYTLVLDGKEGALATRLRNTGASYYLVVKRRCVPHPTTALTLVYEDASSQLWRVP